MPTFIGRQIDFGLGKESVRGTAIAPDFWIPAVSKGVEDMVQYVADEQAIGKIEGDIGSLITKRWAEGDIEGLIRDKSFGIILLALFGAVSSVVKETTAYDHTFSVSQSVQHPSLTIYIQHPAGAYKYALGMVNSLEITAEVGNFVKYTVGFISKESATSTESATYTEENEFTGCMANVYFADDLAGLDTAPAVSVKTVALTFSKNVETDDILGDCSPNDVLNKEFRVEGSVELLLTDATYRTLYIDGTQKAMRIKITSPATIGASSNPALQIDLAKVKITEFARSGGNNDLVKQALTLIGYYSTADSKMVEAKLTNEQDAY